MADYATTFSTAELQRLLDWFQGLRLCHGDVPRDYELADKIALELAMLRPPVEQPWPLAVWLGLPLALVSAAIVSWAYVREQSAVAALCAVSLRAPFRAVRALLRTRAWLIGFAAEIGSWFVYFTALRLAPLALVQSVAASGVALLALLQARGRPSRLARGEQVATGTAVVGLALLGLSLVGSHPSDRTPSAFLAAIWLGASLAAAFAVTLPGSPFSRTAISGLGAGLLFAVGDVSTKLLAGGGFWLSAIVPLIVGYALGSIALQDGFHGPRLDLQLLVYALVVLSAALLVRHNLCTPQGPHSREIRR
jgi:hypothetical protein